MRNPGNAPDDFERRVLEDFAVRIMAGTPPGTLEHSEIVTTNGVRTLRYMKPIMMVDQPCSVCHGGALADDVKAKVSALYPDDQATGFKPGELRGAFSVLQRLDWRYGSGRAFSVRPGRRGMLRFGVGRRDPARTH